MHQDALIISHHAEKNSSLFLVLKRKSFNKIINWDSKQVFIVIVLKNRKN